MGRILTLTGASASGKTTLASLLRREVPGARLIPIITTRPPHKGDLSDEYRHVSDAGIFPNSEAFLWSDMRRNHWYGTYRWDVVDALEEEGALGITILRPYGVSILRRFVKVNWGEDRILSFYLVSPNTKIRHERMRGRNDPPKDIRRRLEEEMGWDADAYASGIPYTFLPDDPMPLVLDRALKLLGMGPHR